VPNGLKEDVLEVIILEKKSFGKFNLK